MFVIVNPQASGGVVGRLWPQVEPRFLSTYGEAHVAFTAQPLAATELAQSALAKGIREIVVVGGDGTINEVVNGLVAQDRLLHPEARVTIIPVGSGSDFARTLGLPIGLEHLDRILQSPSYRSVDIGKARYASAEDGHHTRYFANILEVGVGADVVAKVNQSRKPFGGTAAFLWAIVTTLPGYVNRPVEVRVDGETVSSGPLNSLIVANGQYYGSGLHPAPHAEVDDGRFDVVLFGDVSLGESLSSLGKLRQGKHLDLPKVRHTRGTRVQAESDAVVRAEMDGELIGRLPMDVTILPRLLPVRVLGP